MLEQMKNIESKMADIIDLTRILHMTALNQENLLIIEPFCRIILEKSYSLYNDIDIYNMEVSI